MDSLDELLDKLDESRERLLMVLERLPDEALWRPNAVAGWSVLDLLGNQTAWEAELVTGLMFIEQGKRPLKLLEALAQPEVYDQARFTENQDRELERVFDDFQRVRMELEGWLEIFSERDLQQKQRYKWLQGRSLADVVAVVTFEREARYMPQLKAFAQQWAAEEEEPTAVPTIPLTNIRLLGKSEQDDPTD